MNDEKSLPSIDVFNTFPKEVKHMILVNSQYSQHTHPKTCTVLLLDKRCYCTLLYCKSCAKRRSMEFSLLDPVVLDPHLRDSSL